MGRVPQSRRLTARESSGLHEMCVPAARGAALCAAAPRGAAVMHAATVMLSGQESGLLSRANPRLQSEDLNSVFKKSLYALSVCCTCRLSTAGCSAVPNS